jgi:peptide-methionine (S)-S-oxide reductase
MTKLEKATFGAGCFWHVEETFRKLKGVKETVVGFMGGWKKSPSYLLVSTSLTGHAEVVQITYDPKKIS